MPHSPRRSSRTHVFITHEFYPKRGGIATFVEEISCAVSDRFHSRCRDTSNAPRSQPATRASSACSIDAGAEARTPHVVYPLTREREEVSSNHSPNRKGAREERTDEPKETQAPEVEVWAQALPRGGGRVAEKDFPFRVRRLPLRGTHDLRCLLALARVLFAARRRLREASVYLVEPGPIVAFLWLQFFAKVWPRELCLTFHGSEILKLHRCPLRRALTRRLIARATRVSTLTHYTRDLLFERFPEARARFVLTPGALRADLAQPGEMGSSPALAPFKKERPLLILTVGRLHPRKGQLHTLNALAALPPELQRKVEYWLVGSAAERGEGKRYAKRLRERAEAAASERAAAATSAKASAVAPTLAERANAPLAVRFLGDVPDEALGAIYAQADIFALTSVAHGSSIEGFGLVYLEASAHGLPIIAHAIGGVPEAVSDGHTGILVPPSDDPSALRDAFARLIEDGELRARLGAAGPAWARRQTWHDSAATLLGASS